jgi:hypothetical protein
MPDVSDAGNGSPSAHPQVPGTAGLDGLEGRTAAEAAAEVASVAAHRVGWGFISLYTLAYSAPLSSEFRVESKRDGGGHP